MFCNILYRTAVLLIASAAVLILGGCNSNASSAPTRMDDFDYTSVVNNHLSLLDFANHLYNSKLNVIQVQPIRADVLRAMSAAAILIDKDEIGVYYYNVDVEAQRNIIAKFHKDGFAYILGFRFPVFIAGSFVLTGVEKHPKKKEIVQALRNFK